ncbi:hypothetical protein DRN75_04220 [Nanoarchaeota archaeon]|nr:MAG: hypothetical protein DRN75_04220 [Nanoarchaeota archaeon]
MKRSELVKAAKELNEVLGLEPQINVREKPKRLVELIREAAELVDPELDDLTDSTLLVISRVAMKEGGRKEESKETEEAVEMVEGVKKEKEKEKKGKKKEKKNKRKGSKVGSKKAAFIKELKEGPKTMAEIKKAPWNTSGITFYNVFNALVKAGKAKKEGVKMVWIGEGNA